MILERRGDKGRIPGEVGKAHRLSKWETVALLHVLSSQVLLVDVAASILRYTDRVRG